MVQHCPKVLQSVRALPHICDVCMYIPLQEVQHSYTHAAASNQCSTFPVSCLQWSVTADSVQADTDEHRQTNAAMPAADSIPAADSVAAQSPVSSLRDGTVNGVDSKKRTRREHDSDSVAAAADFSQEGDPPSTACLGMPQHQGMP